MCLALQSLIDDVHFYEEEFVEYVPTCLRLLIQFMERAQEFESKVWFPPLYLQFKLILFSPKAFKLLRDLSDCKCAAFSSGQINLNLDVNARHFLF